MSFPKPPVNIDLSAIRPHHTVEVPREKYFGDYTPGMMLPPGSIACPHEAIKLLNRVELKNPPFPLHWRFTPMSTAVSVEVFAEIKDRISGMPLRQPFTMSLGLPTDPNFLLHWFEKSLRAVYMHEFEEAFHVDGQRVHDPHEGGCMKLHDYNRAGYRTR